MIEVHLVIVRFNSYRLGDKGLWTCGEVGDGGFAICVQIFNDKVYDSAACELIRQTNPGGQQQRCGLEQACTRTTAGRMRTGNGDCCTYYLMRKERGVCRSFMGWFYIRLPPLAVGSTRTTCPVPVFDSLRWPAYWCFLHCKKRLSWLSLPVGAGF